MIGKKCVLLAATLLWLHPLAPAQQKAEVPFYGNRACPVDDTKPVDSRFFVVHDGQRIYTSGRSSMRKVYADPAAYFKKAYPEDKIRDVRLDKCVVMGRSIGENAPSVVWQGHRIPLCCQRCIPRFKHEPAKYLTLALNPDVKLLGNAVCPLMEGEKVEPDIFIVYKNRIIGLCCDSCVKDALEDPERTIQLAKEGRSR